MVRPATESKLKLIRTFDREKEKVSMGKNRIQRELGRGKRTTSNSAESFAGLP